MPTLRVRRMFRQTKTVKDIEPLDIVFTKNSDVITLNLSKSTYPDIEDREAFMDKLYEFTQSQRFIDILKDIYNGTFTSDDILWKKDITVNDVPESVKDSIRKD